MEVRYENLICDPEATMREVADFIHIDFVAELTTLEKPSENIGETAGVTDIVSSNMNKYYKDMTPSDLRRVEEIVCIEAEKSGYRMHFDVTHRPLSLIQLQCLAIYDALNVLRFEVKDKGFFTGVGYFIRIQRY